MKILVVDDLPDCGNYLAYLVDDVLSEIKRQIITLNNPFEAIDLLKQEYFDLVFLDVNMPGCSGFEILDKIKYRNFKAVMVTAHEQYAIEAFEYDVLHYITKPISKEKVFKCIQRFNAKSSLTPSDRITIRSSDTIDFIDKKDILYCKADGNYCWVFYKKNEKIIEKVLSSENLKYYVENLSFDDFIQIHKSYLVNKNKVVKSHKGNPLYLEIEGGFKIQVAARRTSEVKRIFNL